MSTLNAIMLIVVTSVILAMNTSCGVDSAIEDRRTAVEERFESRIIEPTEADLFDKALGLLDSAKAQNMSLTETEEAAVRIRGKVEKIYGPYNYAGS